MCSEHVPAGAIARIRNTAGEVAGTGFLATSELVLTCAHVLGADRPDGPVTIDFPLLPGDTRAAARVVAWHAVEPGDGGDIAVLRLVAAPAGAVPSRLSSIATRWGEQVRILGFPPDLGSDHGVWVEAELRAANGAGWLQIESAPGRRLVGPGFSGSPAFAPATGGVVGMVVAAESGTHTTTGYVLPVGALLAAHPEIAAPDPAEVSPYRGLEPFYEEHAELFRGRAPITERLLDLVGTRSVLVVAGPSGSGKSSVVRAGLVPAVRRNGMDVAVFRVLAGEQPLVSLARALLPVLEPDLGERERLDEAESLARRLSTARGQTLPWLAERLLARAGPGGLLIFADQFEETSADHPVAARELFELLLDLAAAAPRHRDGSPALATVVTLRSGALDELVTDRTAGRVEDGVVFVPPMTREQLAEAVTPAGVTFEPGLVERILDDAGTEPGRLPLVEFALARLWERRSAGVLTHGAYDELGGVSGALAGYAERLYKRLPADEQAAARRLLVGLARPDEDAGFMRRPLRLSDIDSELLPVLGKLSTGRLVVVGKAGDGTEIVELAHQALLHRWPRLGGWLTEKRDFLSWREQLRDGMARWQADDRDQGGLLRGTALDRAEEWLGVDIADLSGAEREYVRASQVRERRRRWVLRGVVAMISVLALVASVLAWLTTKANREVRDQLRIAHSRALADNSARFNDTDPRMALQLAQAAWRAAPTAEAYGVLFTQYAALQPVEKVFQGLWEGSLHRVMANADGSVATFVNTHGLPSTWGGLHTDSPHQGLRGSQPHALSGGVFQLSPSGKLLGYANPTGTVVLWDLERHTPAVMLRDTTQAVRVVKSLTFSPDETRLLIQRSGYADEGATFELWDLPNRRTIPVAARIGPGSSRTAFFGPTPNSVVLGTLGEVNLYDLTTGQLIRPISDAQLSVIADNGATLAECVPYPSAGANGFNGTLHTRDLATGEVRHSVPFPDCFGLSVDSSTNYALHIRSLLENAAHTTGSNAVLTIVDLRQGDRYRMTIPPAKVEDGFADLIERNLTNKIAIARGADGRPVAFIGSRNLLYRQSASEPVPDDPTRADSARAAARATLASNRGDLLASCDSAGTIQLRDAASKAIVATATGKPTQVLDQLCDFTADDKSLLTVRDNALVRYSVPDLTVESRVGLPMPPGLGNPVDKDGLPEQQWPSTIRVNEDNQAVILHAGVLSRWSLTDNQRIGEPTQVRTDPDGLTRAAAVGRMHLVPRHPTEAVVVQPGGGVEVWDLDQHRVVSRLGEARPGYRSLRFDAEGNVAAVLTPESNVQIWNVRPASARGRAIPVGNIDGLLGFAADGKLITIGPQVTANVVRIWDRDTGRLLGTLVATDLAPWQFDNDLLTVFAPAEPRSVRLDPALWFDTLCRLSNRDFTDDERSVLAQIGAPAQRPCG